MMNANHLKVNYLFDLEIPDCRTLREKFKYYTINPSDLIRFLQIKHALINERSLLFSKEFDISAYRDKGVDICILINNTIRQLEFKENIKSLLYNMLLDFESCILSIGGLDVQSIKKFRVCVLCYSGNTMEQFVSYIELGKILDFIDMIDSKQTPEISLDTIWLYITRLGWNKDSYKAFYHFSNGNEKIEDSKSFKESLFQLSQLNMSYSLISLGDTVRLSKLIGDEMELDITEMKF